MQLVIDQFDTFGAAVLRSPDPPFTDDQFLEFCERYPDYRLETTSEGDIVIQQPAHPREGQRNAAIAFQLANWSDEDGRGEVFDSSTGFFLRNGARLSPDSAWVSRERLQGLADDAAMWHVTPEFVIELKSASDRIETVRSKMREWTANGAALGWLIIPETRTVEVFRADGSHEVLPGAQQVSGEGPVAGFVLNLDRIRTGIKAG